MKEIQTWNRKSSAHRSCQVFLWDYRNSHCRAATKAYLDWIHPIKSGPCHFCAVFKSCIREIAQAQLIPKEWWEIHVSAISLNFSFFFFFCSLLCVWWSMPSIHLPFTTWSGPAGCSTCGVFASCNVCFEVISFSIFIPIAVKPCRRVHAFERIPQRIACHKDKCCLTPTPPPSTNLHLWPWMWVTICIRRQRWFPFFLSSSRKSA